MSLTWTPPGADPLIAGIVLRTPVTLANREAYLEFLQGRISGMAERANPEMLARALELPGAWGLPVAGLEPMQISELLVEHDPLGTETATDPAIFPISPEAMDSDPETLEALQSQTILEFLNRVYPTS